MNQPIDTQVNTSAPRLLVMVVHGTFPRGGGGLQLRRNWLAAWARLRGSTTEEASLWPAPAPVPLDKTKPNKRHCFEAGSEFENDLIQRAEKLGLPIQGLCIKRNE